MKKREKKKAKGKKAKSKVVSEATAVRTRDCPHCRAVPGMSCIVRGWLSTRTHAARRRAPLPPKWGGSVAGGTVVEI